MEYLNDTHPFEYDTDGDTMPDGWEVYFGLEPLRPSDNFEDKEGDGLVNLYEYNNSLVNTGWVGGKYGVGKRCSIKITREIINSIHNNKLDNIEYKTLDIFNLQVPKKYYSITTWKDRKAYDKAAKSLAKMFYDNFKTKYKKSSQNIKKAGPKG